MCTTQEENVITMFHSCNTTPFKRSVINMGIRLYNKIPTTIQHLDNLGDFKRKLKLFLLDHAFYLLNELYLNKIIEPMSNNTSKTRNKQDIYFI